MLPGTMHASFGRRHLLSPIPSHKPMPRQTKRTCVRTRTPAAPSYHTWDLDALDNCPYSAGTFRQRAGRGLTRRLATPKCPPPWPCVEKRKAPPVPQEPGAGIARSAASSLEELLVCSARASEIYSGRVRARSARKLVDADPATLVAGQ